MIYTIGHSTRTLDDFLALLWEHGIRLVVDVRRFPTSRRHPHFRREALAAALEAAGVCYRHELDLGGWRAAREDSPNTWWTARGFQGYADHMSTPEFRAALGRLLDDGRRTATAILCAEITPWRCHRQLIADALVARGESVWHILAPGRTERHELNPHARVLEDGRLIYAAEAKGAEG